MVHKRRKRFQVRSGMGWDSPIRIRGPRAKEAARGATTEIHEGEVVKIPKSGIKEEYRKQRPMEQLAVKQEEYAAEQARKTTMSQARSTRKTDWTKVGLIAGGALGIGLVGMAVVKVVKKKKK